MVDVLVIDVEVNDDLVEVDFGMWEGMMYGEVCVVDLWVLLVWLVFFDVVLLEGESFTVVGCWVWCGCDAVIVKYLG